MCSMFFLFVHTSHTPYTDSLYLYLPTPHSTLSCISPYSTLSCITPSSHSHPPHSYLHAEGYSGGALKHGPFALIEGKEGKHGATPIIMIILDDEYGSQMRIAAEEVKARGAEVTMCLTCQIQTIV